MQDRAQIESELTALLTFALYLTCKPPQRLLKRLGNSIQALCALIFSETMHFLHELASCPKATIYSRSLNIDFQNGCKAHLLYKSSSFCVCVCKMEHLEKKKIMICLYSCVFCNEQCERTTTMADFILSF